MLNPARKLGWIAIMVGWTGVSLCQKVAVAPLALEKTTEVAMLGTGTPYAHPDHLGAATAIVVHGTPYLVDCGPGVVRCVAQAHSTALQDGRRRGAG